MPVMSDFSILAQARRVIGLEIDALTRMSSRLGADFEQAVELIARRAGRVIVSGMGKSGHVGRKIAATMASTGTPAFFVHPGEAPAPEIAILSSPMVRDRPSWPLRTAASRRSRITQ